MIKKLILIQLLLIPLTILTKKGPTDSSDDISKQIADFMKICQAAGFDEAKCYEELIQTIIPNLNQPDSTKDSAELKAAQPDSTNKVPDTQNSSNEYIGPMPKELEEVAVMIQHEDKFKKLGVEIPLGYLLYGPPGTGKTFVGKHFAKKINAEFRYVRGSEMQDEFVGGHRKTEELFKSFKDWMFKNNKKMVIFLDELDCLVGTRDNNSNSNHMEKIGAFLREVDSMKSKGAIILGATNYRDRIDPAILRNGRLGMHIECKLPDEATKKHFLEAKVAPHKDYFSPAINWAKIAEECQNCNYPDLEEVVNAAKRKAIQRSIESKGETILISPDDITMPIRKKINFID
jgi:transitional endoplasmic reticulum ATPase